jgi:putative transposase
MEEKVRKVGHSISVLHLHLVWCTKYRYDVLRGDVQLRCWDLLRQTCDALDVSIVKGVLSKERILLQVSYPSSLSVSDLVRRLKGRSAKKLLEEFPELRRRYYGEHLLGIGYGAWSTGNITDAMILEYLEHHRSGPNGEQNFILE